MSTSLMKKITGQLTDALGHPLSQIPSGITVEFTTSLTDPSPGGWIGSANVLSNGSFELLTGYDISTSETVGCTIRNNKSEVQQALQSIVDFRAAIALSEGSMALIYTTGSALIHGGISITENFLPAIPLNHDEFTVKVNKIEFRKSTTLISTPVNEQGEYLVKVPYGLLQEKGKTCDDNMRYKIRTDLYRGTTLIGTSEIIEIEDCCNDLNIVVSNESDYDLFIAELDHYLNTLSEVASVSAAEISSIVVDGETSELAMLTATTKLDEGKLLMLICAAKIADDTEVVLPHCYALSQKLGTNIAIWALLEEDILHQIIDEYAAKRVIADIGDVEDTFGKLQSATINNAKAELNEDGQSIREMIEAIAANSTDADKFIQLTLISGDLEVTEFWQLVDATLGASKTERLQEGMRLLGITGMQAEITKALQEETLITPLKTMATDWNAEDWALFIDRVCTTHSKLCVPLAIRGEHTNPHDAAIQAQYAEKLEKLVKNVFAQDVLHKEIAASALPEEIIRDPEQTAAFLAHLASINFDLRTQNIWSFDFSETSYPESVKEDLLPVQNLLRLTNGKPAVVKKMLVEGLKSSSDIADLDADAFIAAYSSSGTLLSVHEATQLYAKASYTSLIVGNIKAQIQPNNNLTAVFTEAQWSEWLTNPGPSTNPDLQTLFGSLDLCGCTECMSMYSPAAYFTDILNTIKHKLGIPAKAYEELERRRKDLLYIDLTCKNSNTPLPYIDLVNEKLELLILKANGTTVPFESYQTSGTAEELSAYPEHTYKNGLGVYVSYDGYGDVYETTLKTAVYANGLPFDLPLEESRTYLQHLGYKRLDMMKRFRPADTASTAATGISNYNMLSEWLKLSKNEADIIIRDTSNTAVTSNPWEFYNLSSGTTPNSWTEVLRNGETGQGLNTLLKRSSITYIELLQLIDTDFLNKKSGSTYPLEIVSSDVNHPLTCDVNKLYLKSNVPQSAVETIFTKWYRFLRLRNATGWSIQQLDKVLTSLGATDITLTVFSHIAKIHQWSALFKIPVDQLCSLWSDISTRNYIDYNSDSQNKMPSAYDSLFRNKSLINPPETFFDVPGIIVGTYQQRSGTILAAFKIKEEELFRILSFLDINISATVTLSVLSRVYGIAGLSQQLGISVSDLLRLFRINEFNGATLLSITTPGQIDIIEEQFALIDTSRSLLFNLDEQEYLLFPTDEQSTLTPAPKSIQLFYESLRTEMKKILGKTTSIIPDSDLEKTLKNSVIQYFSTQFGMDTTAVYNLLTEVLSINSGTLMLMDALMMPSYLNALSPTTAEPFRPLPILESNDIPDFEFQEIYNAFRRINKIAMIAGRYKMSPEAIAFFHGSAAQIDALDITDLPVVSAGSSLSLLQQLSRLNDWYKVKGKLNVPADEFIQLLEHAVGTSKSDWRTQVLSLTQWNADDLDYLIGNASASTNAGILEVTFSTTVADNDFRKGALLLQLAGIIEATKRIGLTPAVAYNVLHTNITMPDARNIRKAAKGKHSDAEWAKIAKPLQDVLREKQRNAMLSYIVPRKTMISGNDMTWENTNDLFAFLLMDVEMQACMKTSRIKQGINSLQLYMDRIILNLENVNGSLTDHISLTPVMIEQWRQWRKWYRIWEANRKIFLYPENWIEPELRDDKTPFFKELETQLEQDTITASTAEDAYRIYLEMLEEVGRLEPVSAYHQIEKDIWGTVTVDKVHVFSKTSSLPHRYFYRKLENNEWTPWEKVEANIKSDHVVPVMWHRKLYLFWLTFQRKKTTVEEYGTKVKGFRFTSDTEWTEAMIRGGIQPGTHITSDTTSDGCNQWEVTLNWSQYKDNKWLATEISKDTMTLDMARLVMSNSALNSIANTSLAKEAYSWLNNRGEIKMDELFKNRLYLYATPEGMDTEYPDDNSDRGINFNLMFTHGLDEIATGIGTFIWRGDNSTDPYMPRNTYERGYQLLAPLGTRINKMKFAEDPKSDGKLQLDTTIHEPVYTTNTGNKYYSFDTQQIENHRSIRRTGQRAIFNTTTNNGNYKVTARASINGNTSSHFHQPLNSEFLYEDTVHTFFARWEPTGHQEVSYIASESMDKVSFSTAVGLAIESYNPPSGYTLNPSNFSGAVIAQPFNPYAYRFQTFYHAQIHSFIKALNKDGVGGLLDIRNQRYNDTIQFTSNYLPTSLVHSRYPTNAVQFAFDEAYSMYNWEIFFHAPMLIAQRLSENQQFEEAQKWYHYVFNPTSNTNETGAYTGGIERFWKFYPFYKESLNPIETLYDLLQQINDNNPEAVAQVAKWEQNPFQPHVIARMRIMAYMKNVLMKYIDNLIAWADQLFRRDTIESTNEATQLYILAANLLGKRPQEIPSRATVTSPKNFLDLDAAGLDMLSNAMVTIESYFTPNAAPVNTGSSTGSNGNPNSNKMFYFCLPKNDKLLGYWDTVADRLFKIRNCMNIEGTVRQLPLFEPPIDPALLVRATAMGVDINSVLDAVSGMRLPQYRFSYMLQKANEFCSEVRGLGSSLLFALEKKDAEHLSLLRSGQELNMLEQVKAVREAQVTEAEANLESLKLTRENTQQRFRYYSTRSFMNSGEQKHLESLQAGLTLQAVQGALDTTSSTLAAIPEFHIQGISSGSTSGGASLSGVLRGASSAIGIAAAINNVKGSMAATLAGYERRQDDWTFQADTASKELEQLEQQILGAEIRLDISRKELSNHELQMQNSEETDSYMRSKFTNKELYTWMANQIATTYFQSYQLAYDMAKQAETCYNYELPKRQKPVGGFIKFGYWDSLRKGLMSGEKLQFDLRKMETAYMEDNKRELELTKSFSLAMLKPQALLDLKEQGWCEFDLDQIWYNLDFPGHYLRKIKSVSLSIPCIAGPYTTVASLLELTGSSLETGDSTDLIDLDKFAVSAMATSSAQSDAGVFELNFRDERYIPFENAGAISSWKLTMMDDKALRQFDYETISDVILHVKYTARHDENRIPDVKDALNAQLSTLSTGVALPRYFSLKHEFSNEWYTAFQSATDEIVDDADENAGRSFQIKLKRSQFPQYTQGKAISLSKADFHLRRSTPIPEDTTYKLICNGTTTLIASDALVSQEIGISLGMTSVQTETPSFHFTLYKEVEGEPVLVSDTELSDLFIVMTYKLG